MAYRDRNDAYVTASAPLSANLDEIYGILMSYRAAGGGDTPEDVRRALFEGVRHSQWSKPRAGLSQILFLVGDAPPHEDYNEHPSLAESAAYARRHGITVNAIQCGNIRGTDKFWREAAQHGGGEYFAIASDGGTREVKTPFDDRLYALSRELDRRYLPYGSAAEREQADRRMKTTSDTIMAGAPMEAKASRAGNKALNRYGYSKDDLIQAIETGAVKLEDVKTDELPEAMQKMSADERRAFVAREISERGKLRASIQKLSKERAEFIKNNTKAQSDGFDAAVMEALKKQIK